MDKAVALAYGWPIRVEGQVCNPPDSTLAPHPSPLDLGHGFHKTRQGVRFTISESARREVLARLLKLNHERYAEEVAQGLHEKKGRGARSEGRGKRTRATKSDQGASLFGGEADDADPEPTNQATSDDSSSLAPRPSSLARPTPIEEVETDDIMAAFRQAARGRGLLERDELLKLVSQLLGYQRLGSKIEEALRGHLRAALRRRIIEADGASLVRAGTGTMADYGLDELREMFRSVMRKGSNYEREDVIHALARYLGFSRVTDASRDAVKSAINSAIRHGVLGYEGSVLWRKQ